jgi:Fe-S-cluster containining protein
MSKLKQRRRRRAQAKPLGRPRAPVAPQAPPLVAGWSPDQLRVGGETLAQDLHQAVCKARAKADGGYPLASVTGTFLAPLKRVYAVADALSAACLAQPQPSSIAPACTAGCFACCRLYVEVGPWEAFGIADYVTQACEEGVVSRADVLARLHAEVTRYVASGGANDTLRLCAFLSRGGRCGIYPARPSACRSYYSASRAACERYFREPDLDAYDGPPVVRTLDRGITAQLTVAEFLTAQCPPLPVGEIPPVYEMQSAVLRILETPHALVRYLHGEDIFAGCARHTPEPELRMAQEHLLQLHVPVPVDRPTYSMGADAPEEAPYA